MHIELKGKGVTLAIKGQDISLSLQEAIAFQGSLSEAIEALDRKRQEESTQLLAIRSEFNKSKQRSDLSEIRVLTQKVSDLFGQGYIDDGYSLLVHTSLFSSPEDIIFHVCTIDIDGWATLNPDCPPEAMLGVCVVAAMANVSHPAGQLWQSGCFDALILEATGMIAPQDVPGVLQARLFALLAQEIYFPAGQFYMGSNGVDAWDFMRPRHLVHLTKPFSVMRFPTTQYLQWVVSGQGRSAFFGASRPVESITWLDACVFCNAYSLSQGLVPAYEINGKHVTQIPDSKGYRLPTEAEWECFARAWSPDDFPGADRAEDVGWIASNSAGQTQVVGRLKANAAGLYDVCGNVWEWCWDWYLSEVYGQGADRRDPLGPTVGDLRVCRGGGFSSPSDSASLSIRGRHDPNLSWSALGFRMVRNLDLAPSATNSNNSR